MRVSTVVRGRIGGGGVELEDVDGGRRIGIVRGGTEWNRSDGAVETEQLWKPGYPRGAPAPGREVLVT